LSNVLAAPLCAAFVVSMSGCGSPEVEATAEVPARQVSSPEGSQKAADTAPAKSMPAKSTPAKSTPADTTRPPLRPGAKTVALPRAGDRPYDKTFDDIRFDIKPGQPFHRDMLPEEIEALAGQRIRIRGYILPTAQKRGITTFVLVRDNQECCFGPGAALYDCILVEMKRGATAEFSIRPVAVEGTFGIEEVKSGDMHLAIYRMDAESVR
jgi:hypothetical protein